MQQSHHLRSQLHKFWIKYDQFMEKQGFSVVLITCILVIVLSAVYTFHFRNQGEDAPAEMESISAGGSQNAQTLKEAQALIASQQKQPVAVPTQAPFRFTQPVSGFVQRDFSIDEPQLFAAAHYWRVHPGMDFQTEYGAIVSACAAGTVIAVQEDNELGLCVRLAHSYGYETLYAGLSDASYVQAGDRVVQGQTIGHVGSGVLAETDAGPHLHFEAWKGDVPIDPVKLFLGIDE